jgi:phosphoglycolate phosphatase
MKYDTVLFDLDGTLLNTLDDLADSINAVLLKRGYRQRTKEEVKLFIGDGAKMLITRSLPPGTSETEILHCWPCSGKSTRRICRTGPDPMKESPPC